MHAFKSGAGCRRSHLLRAALGICLAVTTNTGLAQQAPTPLPTGNVTVKITKPVSVAAREALVELIEPEPLSRLIDAFWRAGTSVESLCQRSNVFCPPDRDAVLQTADLTLPINPNLVAIRPPTLGIVADRGGSEGLRFEPYSVMGRNSVISRAAGWSGYAAVAVPLSELKASALPIIDGNLVIPQVTSEGAIAIIETDLKIGGSSLRQFRINRTLSPTQVAMLVRQIGNEAVIDTGPPQPSFSFIDFQATPADCSANPVSWPFEVDRVIATLRFNQKIMDRLRLSPRRARILIVDTGIGTQLATSKAFNPFLFADPAEMITSPTVQEHLAGDPGCIDANRNGFWRDVYGAAAGYRVGHTDKCLEPAVDHLSMLNPPPRKATSRQAYSPHHGSYVGGLAVGGPRFVAAFPSVSSYIGLSYFLVTRKSLHPALHVENAPNDIAHSLDYAQVVGADIINMSLKTNKRDEFHKFTDNKHALLVVAAGNDTENLSKPALDNLPAGIEAFGNAGTMITVAALQPRGPKPLWPQSATSDVNVHIAAPGANLLSFDLAGGEVCNSGTSAAAPLVSFTAAMVRALTGAPREFVRSRVLAAADYLASLADEVEDGRRLNIEAALDVLVDRLELSDGTKRGWIEPRRREHLVTICAGTDGPLSHLNGGIDMSLLWEWRKQANGKATFRYQRDALIPFKKGTCDIPSGAFSFFDIETGKDISVQWSAVKKLVPTPFRAVKDIVLNSTSSGELRTVP